MNAAAHALAPPAVLVAKLLGLLGLLGCGDNLAAPTDADRRDGSRSDGSVDGSTLDGPPTGGDAIPWAVSRHVWPSNYPGREESPEDLARDLALIAELGARYVRTDWWWYVVEPERDEVDRDALAFYRWYVDEAARHGLGVIVILSNTPRWARELHDQEQSAELLTHAQQYAHVVAESLGDRVEYFQLWNEPNHFIDFADRDTDVQMMLSAKLGVDNGRTAAGTARPYHTLINVLVDGFDGILGEWEVEARHYLDGAGAAVDILAIDHYPGTWDIGTWDDDLLSRAFAVAGDHGKRLAILETGFSTTSCLFPLNTEDAQASWIASQLPVIHRQVRDPAVHQGVHFELANWFKLEDRDQPSCFNPEDNFGIVRADRSRKPGFDILRQQIADFVR
jgi:hypothetical protein